MQEHDRQEPQADGAAVEDLSATLESLLDASQRSAEQLAQLLERSERAQSEIAERGAALERQLDQATRIPDDLPGAQRPESPATEQMEEARAVAEEADRAKSCFLAAMARELRTPVDGLARMIELLKQTDLDDEQRR